MHDEVDELEGQEIEEEEMNEVMTSEQEFNFKEFVMKFGKAEIIKPYVTLLADFQQNSTHTNHCVVKMLHRLAVDNGVPGMMYQASLFRVFQKILLSSSAKTERYKEIAKFATYIVRNFIDVAQTNPKLFMEILFWKNHKESVEMVDGYGSYKGKVKQTWTEDQEVEVRRLYEDFCHIEEGDVVDKIMERITDPSKTRGQIIRELKRQELISSAKDLKRKTGAFRVTTWTEEQEYELKDLYEKHKASNDIIGNILSNLTTKRSKSKVIEKLFALGLVHDRKELYKRRSKKEKPKNPWNEGENDAPIVDDWSDEEDGGSTVNGGLGRKENSSDSSSGSEEESNSSGSSDDSEGGSNSDDEDVSSRGDDVNGNISLSDTMSSLIEKGYKDQILWIQRAIKRKADDKEKKDNTISVPIVPLTEENETAMEDEVFTSFLSRIGIAAPANEQEAFWRIPGELTVSELRNIQEGLTVDDEGHPSAADKLQERSVRKKKAQKKTEKKKKKKKTEKKKLPEKFNALRDLVQKKKEAKEEGRLARRERNRRSVENVAVTMETESQSEESVLRISENSDEKVTSSKKKRRVKRFVDSDSDDSEKEEEMPQENGIKDDTMNEDSEEISQSQKRPLDFGDSSDEDESIIAPKPRKRARTSNSDSEDISSSVQNAENIEDSDNDDEGPSFTRKSKTRAIQSDDSDEEGE